MEKYIVMNIDISDYQHGQKWPYNEAPAGPKSWADNKDILGVKRICSIVDENGKLLEEMPEIEIPKIDPLEGLNEPTKKLYTKCKGVKLDGTPCNSRMVMDNGYCLSHQNQG